MAITTILAVVPVADFEASVAWYTNLFGREADARPMPGLADWHLLDAGWVQVFHDPDRSGVTALNFAVGNLRAHTVELSARGVALGEVTATDKGARLASIEDLDGNRITFIENPSV